MEDRNPYSEEHTCPVTEPFISCGEILRDAENEYCEGCRHEGYEEGFKAGVKEVVELDKNITQHILQDSKDDWYVESWRLKEWFRTRQAKLKEWRIE